MTIYKATIITRALTTTHNIDSGASTLALKPMGGVNQSQKQRAPVASQNGEIITAKIFLKNFGLN